MDDFKDSTKMKILGAGGTAPERRLMEKSSRPLTASEMSAAKAMNMSKGAAKAGPMLKVGKPAGAGMSAAERKLIERDRPTNASGSSGYKMGGKVGGSKVPC